MFQQDESKNRISLNNALTSKNYEKAFNKIKSKLKKICTSIQQLQDYSLLIGSKSDTKEKSEKIDNTIQQTSKDFEETITLLNDIKDFGYSTKDEKIENIPEANDLEDQCNNYKSRFEMVIKKIKARNLRMISQASYSVRFSQISEIEHVFDDPKENTGYKTGRDFFDDIEGRKSQNSIIDQATFKINSVSRKSSIQRIINQNKAMYDKNRKESLEIKMESKISSIFKQDNTNFFTRNFSYILLIIIIIIVFFYFIKY